MTQVETAYIPRAADFATRPMPRPGDGCGFCGIRLGAIPVDPVYFAGAWYHPNDEPGGCLYAARHRHYGRSGL